MAQYVCPCGFVYSEDLGMPSDGIKRGTAFSEIPSEWRCPVCGLSKDYFECREIAE